MFETTKTIAMKFMLYHTPLHDQLCEISYFSNCKYIIVSKLSSKNVLLRQTS